MSTQTIIFGGDGRVAMEAIVDRTNGMIAANLRHHPSGPDSDMIVAATAEEVVEELHVRVLDHFEAHNAWLRTIRMVHEPMILSLLDLAVFGVPLLAIDKGEVR